MLRLFPLGNSPRGLCTSNHLSNRTLCSQFTSRFAWRSPHGPQQIPHGTSSLDAFRNLSLIPHTRLLFTSSVFRKEEGERHKEEDKKKKNVDYKAWIARANPIVLPRIRFLLNRGHRWTSEQFFTLLSWFAVGTTTAIIIGTTTLLTIILWLASTFDSEDYLTMLVSNSLTKQSGITISYESARGTSLFREGRIKLSKVSIYRPPPVGKENHGIINLTIEELEVKLSVWWMLEGKGLVKEAVMKGVRGTIDRRTEWHDPEWKPTRKVWSRGDFELTSFSVYDMLLTMHYPDPNFRPVVISIFSMQCGLFRKQWLLYDILHSRGIVGVFDGCLFNFGPPQRQKITTDPTKKEMMLKIDGLNMDLICTNASGPVGWITEGTLDIDMRFNIPVENPQDNHSFIPHEMQRHNDHDHAGEKKFDIETKIRFNHIKMNPPLYSADISWLNNALVHPIARYMNLHSKHIQLSFNLSIPECNFDGAWTPAEAGFWDVFSESVYNALILAAEEQRKSTSLSQLLRYIWMLFG